MSNEAIVLTGTGIDYYQLAVWKSVLKLEVLGMKGSGGAIRPRIAERLGLKPRDSHEKFIAEVAKCMEVLLEEKRLVEALRAEGMGLLP